MTLYDTFRANLSAAIAANECSQGWLAEQSGYSVSYIHRVLHGTQRNPTIGFVECIAAALGTTPLSMLQERADT